MIRGIHHIAISTSNLERAIEFYRDELGFTLVGEYEWHVGTEILDQITSLENTAGRYVMIRTRNVMLEIFEFSSPRPKEDTPQRSVADLGITHVSLETTDIDSDYARLKANGMVFNSPPLDFDNGRLRATYGYDPDGNVIELMEFIDKEHPEMLEMI